MNLLNVKMNKIKEMNKRQILDKYTENVLKFTKSCIKFFDILTTPKLKIAIISYYYKKPVISGVGIHTRNLAKYLVKHNCKVHVFCSGEETDKYKEDGVIVHTIGKILNPLDDKHCKKRLEYDLFESEVTHEIIRENINERFDIIHTQGALTKSAFIIKKAYNIKWVHTFHAIEKLRIDKLSKEEKQFKDLISWIESTVNHCDGAIFVSNDLMKEGIKNYCLSSKTLIPNGVDIEKFVYSPIVNKNVLFIGRFSKEKGIDTIIEMIPEIMDIKDITLTLVCPYNSLKKGELKEMMDKLQEQKRIFKDRLEIITKSQDQEKLCELYKNCQVYIQPSKYESFGLCILEAMATGRPVVAFKVGGIPEVIGDTGFTVNTKKEFIKKIKDLLENKKECERIGKKANQRARIFDWNKIARETIQYYKEVKNE